MFHYKEKELKEKADILSLIKTLIVVKAGSKKNRIFICGICLVCNKDHMSNEGNWIITASKLHLCKEPCWDEYLANPSKYKRQKTPSEAPELTKRPRPRGKYLYNKYKLKWA